MAETKLPETWTYVALGEVGTWTSGTTPDKSQPRYWNNGNIPWASPKDMKSSLLRETQDYITHRAVDDGLAVMTQKGSVLLVSRSGILKHSLPVALTEIDTAINQDIKAVLPASGIDPRYLLYALQAFSKDILRKCTKSGTTVPNIDTRKLLEYRLPLAPKNEQLRIVRELEKQLTRLDNADAALDRASRRVESLRLSTLRSAFRGVLEPELDLSGDSFEPDENANEHRLPQVLRHNQVQEQRELALEDRKSRFLRLPELPEGWQWTSINEVASVSGGLTKGPKRDALRERLPYLRVANVYANELRLDEIETIGVDPSERERVLLKKGDLLVVEGNGSKDQIGRVAVWDGSINPCVHQNHLIKVRPFEFLSPKWLLYWLLSPEGRSHIVEASSSTSGLHTLSIGKVESLPAPLPPDGSQERIVQAIEEHLSRASALERLINTQRTRSRQLRQSLLNDVFNGNLVEQSSDDEPASVLLDALRSSLLSRQQGTKPKPKRTASIGTSPNSTSMESQSDLKAKLSAAFEQAGPTAPVEDLFTATNISRDDAVAFYDALCELPEVLEQIDRGQDSIERSKGDDLVVPERDDSLDAKSFRLVELHIDKYKNLENYSVDFRPEQALDVVLGWNGTGKSNLFEVLTIIFRDAYAWKDKGKWTTEQELEGFRIKYLIEDEVTQIKWNRGMSSPEIKAGPWDQVKANEDRFVEIKRKALALPRFVFGYYSGPSRRFPDLFASTRQDHYHRLLKAKDDTPETRQRLLEDRKFFCAETHHAKYALLSFFFQEDEQIQRFLNDHLRVVELESVLFVLKRPRWHRNNKPLDFWGAYGLLRPFLERLRSLSAAPMALEQRVDDGYKISTQDHYFLLLPNKQRVQELGRHYGDAVNFFLALESTDLSSIIHDVRIRLRVRTKNGSETIITFKEMSEGEQQLLIVLGLLRFTKASGSLILLDEPDTHLNPHWQLSYLRLLLDALIEENSAQPRVERSTVEALEKHLSSQILLSTHDPLAIANLLKENIHLLKRREESEECFAEQPLEDPRGLGFTGILTSEMFGLRSDLDEETLVLLDKQAELVAKGRLSHQDERTLVRLTKKIEALGFKSASSDPYYRAFLRATGRRRAAKDLLAKKSLTRSDRSKLDEETDRALAEIDEELGLL